MRAIKKHIDSFERGTTMNIETITVTPEVAQEFLERNHNNRKIKPRKVDKFAYQLSEGQWITNGDTIRFDVTGTLIDGQHRLKAVVRTGVPMTEQLVVRNLPVEAWRTIDDGAPRTFGDVLGRHGLKNAGAIAGIAKVLMLIDNGYTPENKLQKNLITKEELEKWVLKNEDQVALARATADSVNKVCPFSVTALAVVFYQINKQFGEEVEAEFISGLTDGVPYGEQAGDPRVRVRNWMLRKRQQKRGLSIRLEAQIVVLTNAFNAWKYNKQLNAIHVPAYSATNFPRLGNKPKGMDKLQDLIPHAISPYLVAD
jgi:hypothetical protein